MSTEHTHRRTTTSFTSGWSRVAPLTVAGFVAALVIFFSATAAMALVNPLLSARQTDSTDLAPFTKWTSVLARYEAQHVDAAQDCMGEKCLNQKWEELLTELEDKDLDTKISQVNAFFNAISYVNDRKNYGTTDYWQTPYEMFARGGDCEDYAIGKYISLKRLGVSESDMRILVVRDQSLGGVIHAILEVDVDGEAKILDNQSRTVKAVASIYRYNPVFAINESKWWAYSK
jgi:predicted transglutaminase-like cysteine proteinase